MKKSKKILALLLSVLMIFTMASNSVVAVAETTEKTEIEEVESKAGNIFDSIKGIIDGIHNLVGSIMAATGKECVFCDEFHAKDDSNEPTIPDAPQEPEQPSEPDVPAEPEEPKEDNSTQDNIEDPVNAGFNLFDSIHNLVGEILAILGKSCPMCDKIHGKDVDDSEEITEPEVPEEIIYTVSFDLNYEGVENAIPSQKINKGEKVVEPDEPKRDGYIFIGWFEDKELTKSFDFTDVIGTDKVIYAGWFFNEDNIAFDDFYANTHYVLINTQTEIIFTALLSSEKSITQDVYVYDEEDNIVCKLYDDGLGEDEIANDGIFVGKVNISTNQEKQTEYFAKYSYIRSEGFEINYYRIQTEEEIAITIDFDSRVQEVLSSRVITNSFERNKELIIEAYYDVISFLNQEKANGVIESYFSDVSGFDITLTNGSKYYILYSMLLSSGDEEEVATFSLRNRSVMETYNNNLDNQIVTFDWSRDDNKPIDWILDFNNTFGDWLSACNLDKVSKNIEETVVGYKTFKNYTRKDFTVSSLKNLSDKKVVIISSHGNNFSDGYVLLTGEKVTTESLKKYQEQGLMNVELTTSDGYYMVKEKFFENNYKTGDFKNTLVYLSTCHSGDESVGISKILLNKGCSVVLGNTNSISSIYNSNFTQTFFKELTSTNEETGELKTIAEALRASKNIEGEFDSEEDLLGFVQKEVLHIHPRSTVEYFGDSNFRLNSRYVSGIASSIVNTDDTDNIFNGKATIRYTDDSGYFSTIKSSGYFSLPVSTSSCDVIISAYGYLTRKIMNIQVNNQGDTYLSESILIPNDATESKVGGKIINSITAETVSGAEIKFRNNHGVKTGDYIKDASGNIITITSDSQGGYYTELLEPGYYTAEITKDGFVTEYQNIWAYTVNTIAQDISISPSMPEGQFRVVLTWDADPSDLDSHLYADANGSTYHVYYSDKNAYYNGINIINLDVDDTTGYGPETTTIKVESFGTYRFYVHKYSGYGSIATSNAQVKLYNGNNLVGTFSAPVDQGNGIYWNVFTIKDGNVITKNTITSSPDLSY